MEAREQTLTPIDFADYLLERRALDEGQLLDVLAEHWLTHDRLGDTIARRGYLSATEVERLAAEFESLQVVYV
jgi:hypothetical protein